MARSNTTTALNKHLIARHDVKGRHIALQALWHQCHGSEVFVVQLERRCLIEHLKDFFRLVPQRTQENRCRQLTTTVNSREHLILGIKFKVEPGTTVRDDSRAVEQLARRVRLTTVMIEENTRRPVQLRYDNALGSVDNEGAVIGHERNLAHVDILFFDVFDGFRRCFLVVNDKADFDAKRAGVGCTTQHTLFDVENRGAQRVVHILKCRIATVAHDGEH